MRAYQVGHKGREIAELRSVHIFEEEVEHEDDFESLLH
jgi:hypothetical protein